MLWKPVVTFGFMLLMMPHEPKLGLEMPASPAPIAIAHVQAMLFDALDQVRADLKAHRSIKS